MAKIGGRQQDAETLVINLIIGFYVFVTTPLGKM
jgi:hypothetical protein